MDMVNIQEVLLNETDENRRICESIRRIRDDFKKMGEEGGISPETSTIWTPFLYGDECFRGYRYGSDRLEEPYGYIYYTECLNNGMGYIGQHKGNVFDETYYGSGVYFSRALSSGEIDKNLMDRVVLDWAYSENELDSKEMYWIDLFSAYESENFYNANRGGQFGFCFRGCKFTEEHKRRLSESRKGYKHTEIAKKRMSENCPDRHGENNTFYGKHHTEETKKLISDNLKGRFVGEDNPWYGCHHREETIEKLREISTGRKRGDEEIRKFKKSLKKHYEHNESPLKGRKLSEDTRRKMSNSRKGKTFTEEHKRNLSKSLKDKAKNTEYCNSKKVKCVETGQVFKSMGDANRYLKSQGIKGSVYDAFRDDRKRAGGFTWQKVQ